MSVTAQKSNTVNSNVFNFTKSKVCIVNISLIDYLFIMVSGNEAPYYYFFSALNFVYAIRKVCENR